MPEISNQPSAESPEDLAEPTEKAQATKQTSVARSAGIVSIAVMFSRVLGLVREMIFARYFGVGFIYDAYQVAFRIPNVLRDLFAEGVLSAAFVKVFTDYQINKSEKEAWHLASLVLNALAVVLSVICILGILFSHQFVAIIAMGVLNTKGIFGIPASASTVFNIASIVFGLGMAFWLSGGGWQVANGVS